MEDREELDPSVARAARALRQDEAVSEPGDVARVMQRVAHRPRPRALPAWGLLVAARRRPLMPALAAALVGLLGLGLVPLLRRTSHPAPFAARPSGEARPVRFVFDAPPGASGVSVVGDFNGWRPAPLQRADGRWVVTLDINAGSYTYLFMVDGARWMADPAAPRAADDGLGTPSSMLVVETGVSAS